MYGHNEIGLESEMKVGLKLFMEFGLKLFMEFCLCMFMWCENEQGLRMVQNEHEQKWFRMDHGESKMGYVENGNRSLGF